MCDTRENVYTSVDKINAVTENFEKGQFKRHKLDKTITDQFLQILSLLCTNFRRIYSLTYTISLD